MVLSAGHSRDNKQELMQSPDLTEFLPPGKRIDVFFHPLPAKHAALHCQMQYSGRNWCYYCCLTEKCSETRMAHCNPRTRSPGLPDNFLHGDSDWRFSIPGFSAPLSRRYFSATWRRRQLPAAYSDRTCYRAIQRSADFFRCNRLLPAVFALFHCAVPESGMPIPVW